MTSRQNTVRFLAFCLAGFIILCMCASVMSVLYFIFPQKDAKTHEVSLNEVDIVDITISKDQLRIETGNSFMIKIPSYVSYDYHNDKLVVKEKRHPFTKGVVTITIPYGKVFKEFNIDAGIGKITIDNIVTDSFTLEAGVGDIDISKLNVFKKFKIDGGVGDISISNADVSILDVKAGVGNISIGAFVRESGSVDLGIGNVNLDLLDNQDLYRFDVSKGIGSVNVFGNNVEGAFGTGDIMIRLDGGIGNINVH